MSPSRRRYRSSFAGFGVVCLLTLLGSALLFQRSHITALAREIEATSEWTLLEENDTIPAGLHVRMDMTTGEKWVKLMDDDKKSDFDKKKDEKVDVPVVGDVEIAVNGGLVSASTDADYPSAVTLNPQSGDSAEGTKTDEEEPPRMDSHIKMDETVEPDYDYEMMHRTLSRLPPDEQKRMGGLPQLPGSNSRSFSDVTAEEREAFQVRMKEIWIARQKELENLQEEFVADLPAILKERIKNLEEYLKEPSSHLGELIKKDNNGGDNDVMDVIEVLEDLEYHLSDVDMARDFHTLGGWPILVSLLSDSVHLPRASPGPGLNSSIATHDDAVETAISEKIYTIQSKAAWAIGTAVKNVGEFHLWSLEDFSDAIVVADPSMQRHDTTQTPVTVITLLIDALRSDSLMGSTSYTPSQVLRRQKNIYALGSILRGNRMAQKHFLTVGGTEVLGEGLESFINGPDMQSRQEGKFVSRAVALADDIIMDVSLHPSEDDTASDIDIVNAFTTGTWCHSVIQLVGGPLNVREAALRAAHVMLQFCEFGDIDESRNALTEVRGEFLTNGDMDPDHRDELVALVDSILQKLSETFE